MTLSEKLYALRRKQGLSQEGLAEKLDCSRQVISKWENGTTTPDAEMLQKYSELFGVSIDYLVKEDIEEPTSVQPTEKNSGNKKLLGIVGLVISLLGCVSLIVFGAITVFNSETADQIAGASVIVIDGTFIAMLASVLFVVFGAVILIKSMK
ncbi:MAG: helix-turn-helix transcriptional regulator [Clostridia bacterium]|nr:helix-turn-helix transcriptional regulator [Clostridia bacterium]